MNTELILDMLDKVKPAAEGWKACCPAHDDKTPSMTIKHRDGRTIIGCFAGCTAQEIVNALGLKLSDLFDYELKDKYQGGKKSTTKRHEGLNYEVLTVPHPTRVDQYIEKKIALPYNKVIIKLERMTRDTMATVDSIMFAIPANRGDKIDFLERPYDFFGQLGIQTQTAPDWIKTGAKMMTQQEAFSRIAGRLTSYRGVETAPHCPPMRNIYYNHPELPPIDETDPIMLNHFLDKFCPQTPEDRALILSLFMTSVWGGTESQRPAFVIASPDGRGSGKSSLGEMTAALLNQEPIAGATKGDIDELLKRILSPIGMTSRVIMFDNETGRVSSGQLAGLITAQTISGKRMYHGEGRRPNNMLWVITLNTPTLDSDLASRCIPISVVKPKQTIAGWKTDALAFLDQWRWEIIAQLIHMLMQPTNAIRTRTRWATWEQEVLSKLPPEYGDTKDIQALIVNRQREFDDEADEIELIRDAFEALIRYNSHDPKDENTYFISNSDAAKVYLQATGSRSLKNTALRELKNLAKDQIDELEEYRSGKTGRGFLWFSANAFDSPEDIVIVKGVTHNEPF